MISEGIKYAVNNFNYSHSETPSIGDDEDEKEVCEHTDSVWIAGSTYKCTDCGCVYVNF